MANDYYTHSTFPATGSQGSSASMRSELDAIDAGFAKLAPLTGNGNKFLLVNSGGTAQTASSLLSETGGLILVSGVARASELQIASNSSAGTLGVNPGFYSPAAGQLGISANSAQRVLVLATGQVLFNSASDSGFGLVQVLAPTGAVADFATAAAATSLVRVRNTGAQVTGLVVQNSATGSTSASGLRLLIDASGAAFLNQEGASSLNFGTGGSTQLSIASGGLVTAAVGFAGPASGLTALNASNLGSGTVPDGRFPATLPSMSGVNLTALNASNVSSGTLANARTTGATAATANTLALRDANGDTAVRALTLGNTAVAGNVLDWVEKGVSFTPALTFGGGSTGLTYSSRSGTYSRVGNVVFFSLFLGLSAKGSSTGIAKIGGLPYANGGQAMVATFNARNVGLTGMSVATIAAGASDVGLEEAVGGGVAATLADTDFTDTSQVTVSGFFIV